MKHTLKITSVAVIAAALAACTPSTDTDNAATSDEEVIINTDNAGVDASGVVSETLEGAAATISGDAEDETGLMNEITDTAEGAAEEASAALDDLVDEAENAAGDTAEAAENMADDMMEDAADVIKDAMDGEPDE